MLYRYEYKLITVDCFGPISMTQRPDRVVSVEGWKAVGVAKDEWLVMQRRIWFWQDFARKVVIGHQVLQSRRAGLRWTRSL